MADARGTPELERPIARVTVTTDAELLPDVVRFKSVETVCRNVIEHAFGPDEEGQYDVAKSLRSSSAARERRSSR